MSHPITILTARTVVTMDPPVAAPIVGGAVAIVGDTIVDVGTLADVRADCPAAAVHDFGDAVIVPGLINAHTHLELSLHERGAPPATFVEWLLRGLVPTGKGATTDDAEVVRAVKAGAAECLKCGVTTVGDISGRCATTRTALRDGPLHVVSYGEVRAMSTRRELLEPRLAAASETRHESDFLRVGVSPHAPYSVEPDGYRKCLAFSRATGRPIATHLAETQHEAEFLATHGGPFGELWKRIGGVDTLVPKFLGGPIRYAKTLGLLETPTLLAHVNYCDDRELSLLATGRASVVYCPRTHAFFAHPPHRWRDMLRVRVNVAVGTDSRASSPDLNLLSEVRFVRDLAPDLNTAELLSLVTTRAAAALQMSATVGSLSVGKRADLAIYDSKSADALRDVIDATAARETWVAGKKANDE